MSQTSRKHYFSAIMFLLVAVVCVGCANKQMENSTQKTKEVSRETTTPAPIPTDAPIDSTQKLRINLNVSKDPSSKAVIPNSDTKESVINISFCLDKGIKELKNGTKVEDRQCGACSQDEDFQKINGDIVGEKRDFAIAGYAVASMEVKRDVQIYGQNNKRIKGNSLVLILNHWEDADIGAQKDYESFLVVINYSTGKTFFLKIPYSLRADYLQLHVYDMNGDGEDEMIVSDLPNKTINWDIYSVIQERIQAVPCKYRLEEHNYLWFPSAIQTKFKENYRFEIQCQDVGLCEEQSILSLGIKQKDIDIAKAQKDDIFPDFTMYKNGKLRNRKEDEEKGFVDSIKWNDEDGYSCFDKLIDGCKIRIDNSASFKNKYGDNLLGIIYLDLCYDTEKGLYIDSAKIKWNKDGKMEW